MALEAQTDVLNIDAYDARVSLGKYDRELMGHEDDWGSRDFTQSFLEQNFICSTNCNLHSHGCWGFYLVRTCFAEGDDERVAQATAKLDNAFAMIIQTNRKASRQSTASCFAADVEIMRRFHNVVIDDAKLRDASISEIRSYLQTWFAAVPEPQNGPRFNTVILLDSQVLDNLNRLPEKISTEDWYKLQHDKDYAWVKFVDVGEDWGETCRAWIWDLVEVFELMSHKDYGVSEIPLGWGPDQDSEGDLDWRFYDP